ncbi:hypothetical protein RJ639_006200 [Escallonia herrerae]|uniref:Uncharacterized protein n=1 Tax=Escallonia herrerae TaxID=1293975 RepID=A0AA89ASZ1_9ASTE|nr:hypothetical protein RJ639_006200 [Escallonia herrerae]
MVGLHAMVTVEDQAVGHDRDGGVGVVAEEGGKVEALVVVVVGVKVGQSVVLLMSTFRFGTFIGILLVLVSLSTAHGHVIVACMMAYEEGGSDGAGVGAVLIAMEHRSYSHLLLALDEESVRGILKETTPSAIHDIEIEFTSIS